MQVDGYLKPQKETEPIKLSHLSAKIKTQFNNEGI